MRRRVAGPALVALSFGALGPARSSAQRLEDHGSVVAGAEFRSLSFGAGLEVKKVRQVSEPFGLVIPAGRFSLDVGAAYARITLERPDGTDRTVDGLTDTQIRGTYTFGRDFLVASAVLNLPTGASKASLEDFSVLGAVSSPFFGFPVNSFANGLSLTTGVAVAVPAGDWNVGIAGSVRATKSYTPFVDAGGAFTYDPGLEGRIRVGADRVLGASHFTIGFTFSTLGTDQFGLTGQATTLYRPGKRWIGEVSLATPVGRGSATFYGWHYQRASGDSVGGSIGNRERLISAGVLGRWPVADRVTMALGIAGQLSDQDAGTGRMVGASGGLEIGLGPRFVFEPTVRYDIGSIGLKSSPSSSIRGVYLAAFVRALF